MLNLRLWNRNAFKVGSLTTNLLTLSLLFRQGLAAQQLDSLLIEVLQPHHDRLEGMIERREIRVLVHWSKTDYFLDRGQPRGIVWELARDFEKFINHELRTGKKPINLVVVPVSRNKLVEYLEQGRGDISFAECMKPPNSEDASTSPFRSTIT